MLSHSVRIFSLAGLILHEKRSFQDDSITLPIIHRSLPAGSHGADAETTMLLAIVALTTYFHANCVNISIYTKYATCMPDWVSDILSFIFIKQSN
jgi:hypothetical protein